MGVRDYVRDALGRFAVVAGRAKDVQVTHRNTPGPMDDDQFHARAARVESVIGAARKRYATEVTHAPEGVWSPERDRLHRQIAGELYARDGAHVPNEGRAIIAGGLGGSGKTTVLTKHAGVDTSRYLTVNPDDIKEELARRDLVPDVPGGGDLSPMERSALIHEESSRIAGLIAQMAYRDKKNLIWDITMSSGSSVQARVDAIHTAGYGHLQGVFVDIPAEVSVSRAMARYRRGVDDYHSGKGYGGRYVPPSIIRAQQTGGGATINRDVFDSMRGVFDQWAVYDNSVTGRAPVKVAAS